MLAVYSDSSSLSFFDQIQLHGELADLTLQCGDLGLALTDQSIIKHKMGLLNLAK